MGVEGFFKADREEHRLGKPIWITLFVKNGADKDVYLFIPRGVGNSFRLLVTEGKEFEISRMSEEPEDGLIPELRLSPGETHAQRYQLTQWLLFKQPGHYRVGCTLEIECYDISLRQKSENRLPTIITIATDLPFTILP